ncbi:MAG TPA: DNA repair protein RadA [Chitinophagaceae bacterium]|nr:DNA repair protein RadA [Chitinophagaceae bacterium]MCC6634533.1 DNA repair protein RadA [Chitinophagaceae bacterium]HMZ45475.1 DNA repair protein RadA [Chitinophagaceae bacterium]HNM35098.1 DNA repair protein RadA [Chitinophagaceae bacterium]HNN30753.1 DNA repair protein RadA [Chitinophagaceae bacterium]
MAKIKTSFFCNNCGHESTKWLGKCPSCNEWNTFIEEVIEKNKSENWNSYSDDKKQNKIVALNNVSTVKENRIVTTDAELNRVLGGGIVHGSIILVAGEPGIGKSTLFLQHGLMMKDITILYISGEESEQQIKMRADRLKMTNNNFYLLTETNTQIIFQEIKKLKPQLVIIDSIQTLQSNLIDAGAGSVSQIKECAAEFQRFAKETNTPVFLIGHITKDGNIAGPKILEHMVDTVLQFEGDRHYAYRILRTIKNRFGSTAELGIYEMTGEGMRAVNNPSEILISQRDDQLSGIAIAATIEGMRPLLIEVQALVTQSVYGTPQRTVTGFDLRRLQLLLAVLEKRGGFLFGTKDVFVNIAGGLKIEDPSIDLAVICALLSSYDDTPISHKICFAGEVGLNGEIRAVNRIEQRIAEAEKLGFEKIFVSKFNKKSVNLKLFNIDIIMVSQLHEVYQKIF